MLGELSRWHQNAWGCEDEGHEILIDRTVPIFDGWYSVETPRPR